VLRNRIYYTLKPFIPQRLRTAVRRRFALRLRDRVRNTWPIMPGSERAPKGWPGWPQGKKFALVLTHDVEGQAGLEKCRRLMRLEMELGFRSSFNFIPEGSYPVPSELREELAAADFEIGVHDLKHDGRLYQSRREFNQNAARINHYLAQWGAQGFRSGFMLHNLNWLHELDIHYDMSTFDTDPFEPQPEGRDTIFPFWVNRPTKGDAEALERPSRQEGYVELPYTLPQDSTLFLLLREANTDIWTRKVDWIAEHGGMVLLDTHPDYMSFSGSRQKAVEYPVALYQQLLDYISSEYSGAYWHALPREVAAHVLEGRNGITAQTQATSKSLVPHSLGFPIELRSGGLLDPVPQPSAKTAATNGHRRTNFDTKSRLNGKHAAVLLFSHYPADPRPRRAAEALAAEGVTIDLVCLQDSRKEPRRETINGVRIFRVPLKRDRGGKMSYVRQYSAFILASFAYLAFRSVTRRYDFVHVHNMPDVLVFSSIVPKAFGAKVVLDLHDPMPELMQTIFKLPEQSFSVRLLKRMERRSIAFADLVLTVNLACKKIYSSRSCTPEKIKVVLNSPDDHVFRFRSINSQTSNGKDPAKPFIILYHGSLVQRNGFDLAVDALEIARQSIPAAQLLVCGERTSFFDAVMESARKRGLRDHVQYLGVRNLNQIVDAIDSCNLGIIPNHRNIFTEINTPTRIFEYLALGKPVIAPRSRGIQDYFSDDDLIFFNLGDANDLARKIEFAFHHPSEVGEIVKRGQNIYLGHTWSQEKFGLLTAFNELL
jgi:glycosyltransferase involved in cell wall biosynthesis